MKSESSMFSEASLSSILPFHASFKLSNRALRSAVSFGTSSIICGVHQRTVAPAASRKFSISNDSSMVFTPSSTPYKTCEWLSTKPFSKPDSLRLVLLLKNPNISKISLERCFHNRSHSRIRNHSHNHNDRSHMTCWWYLHH